MNNLRRRRLILFIMAACVSTIAIAMILYALKQNINVFLSPSDVQKAHLTESYVFRLGGMVKPNSIKRNDLHTQFVVTDFSHDIKVAFDGVLPDLFREGKGVLATGHLNTQGVFVAREVLAKHDENYMPKSVYLNLTKNKKA